MRLPPFRAAAVALVVLPMALLAEAVLGRAAFFERDVYSYWIPGVEAFVRAVGEGAWPLWDPLTSFGRPLLADPNIQYAYPPTWLNLVMPPATYFTWFVVLHCAWSGMGALWLCRQWGFGAAAATWAAAAWMLSGPLLSTVIILHHFPSATWMPWVLLAVERLLETPGARAAAWLGVAAAGMALAGSADMCLMIGVAALARIGFGIAAASSPERRRPASLVAALAGAGVLAALLCAIQWWPTITYLARGTRGSAGAAFNMYWSAHPASLLDVVLPSFVAEMPLGTRWRTAIFEGRGPLLRSLYVGLPAVLLAAVGLAGRWRLRWLFAGLAIAYVVGAMGRFTPFYPAIAELPLVRLMRYPVKLAVPAALFLCLLSGAGLETLRSEWSARQRRGILLAAGLAAVVGLATAAVFVAAPRLAAALGPHLDPSSGVDVVARLRSGFGRLAAVSTVAACLLAIRVARGTSTGLVTAVLSLGVVDAFTAARSAVRLAPAALLSHRPPVLDAFPRPGQHRVFVFQYPLDWLNGQFTRPPAGWNPEWAWALGHGERLAPPIPTRWGISSSFDGDFTGLAPVAYSRLTSMVEPLREWPLGLALLRMSSVTDVLSFEKTFAGAPPRLERMSVYETPVRVFSVPYPIPRAYVVSGTRIDTPAGEVSVVTAPDFDPTVEVALDAAAGRPASAPAPGPPGRAEIVARRSDRLTIDVSAPAAGVLVVTESFDPGWRAWVDGAPAPVWRANAIFRGVPVAAGDHRVEMRYRPPAVAWGAGATLLGCIAAAVIIGRRPS